MVCSTNIYGTPMKMHTNEDAGKILFSDQEGETLNFQNKEIHYYKKSETDPLAKLKQILTGIQ